MKKFSLIFYVVCAYAILLASCANNNGAGSVNFEISKADFEKLTKIYKDNNGDPNGEPYREVEVSIRGGSNQTQVIKLYPEQYEMREDISCTFDGIPVGSTVYADINISRHEPTGAAASELETYGYSEKFTVKKGSNSASVRLWPANECEFGYSDVCEGFYKFNIFPENSDSFAIENNWERKKCIGNNNDFWFVYAETVRNINSSAEIAISPDNQMNNYFITVDTEKGNFYLCGFEGDDNTFRIYDGGWEFSNVQSMLTDDSLVLSSNELHTEFYNESTWQYNVCDIIANNDIFYILEVKSVSAGVNGNKINEYWLYTIKKDDPDNYTKTKLDFYKYFIGVESYSIFQDMVFYEDNLYFLLGINEYYGCQDLYGYGCLVKYNPVTEKMDVLGLSDDKLLKQNYRNIGVGVYQERWGGDDNDWYQLGFPSYNDALVLKKSITVNGREYSLPNIYTPSPLSSVPSKKAFYGPGKFIGLKPRKLVISDEGLFFYADGNGVLRAKNLNRKVTVDLVNFAIENVEDSDCSFEKDVAQMAGTENPDYAECSIQHEINSEDRVEFLKTAFNLEDNNSVSLYGGDSFYVSNAEDQNFFYGIKIDKD